MRNSIKQPKLESSAKFINISILFILIFMLFTGCSNGKTEELQKEVDNLSSQYEDLQKIIRILIKNIRSYCQKMKHYNLRWKNIRINRKQ